MKTKPSFSFVALVLLTLSLPCHLWATLVNLGPGSFTPSAPVITFDEFPLGTVDPSIPLTSTNSGSVTVTFVGKTYNDGSSDSNPVLGGHTDFFESVSVTFSEPVANVGMKAGSFEVGNSTTIEAFDANGMSLGFVKNTLTGFQLFGLADTTGANVIKRITVYISAVEPAGFEIDNVSFKANPPPPPTGSLTVLLNPWGTLDPSARWQVDGGDLQEHGAVVTNLSLGDHTLSFTAVSGWYTPSNQTVTILPELTIIAQGTYVPMLGDLQVTLNPPEAVALGAQWQVDGGGFRNSGAVVTNLVAGSHTISFSTVAGWNTPANQNVTVNANVITTLTNAYSITTKIWNGSASTDWLNPVNWTPVGVPTGKDTVILNNGGTITFSAPVTHNGPFDWSAGRISGDPNPFTLGSNAVMTLAPGGFKYLSGAILNGGTIQTTSNITLYVDNNPPARLVNLPGAVIDSTGVDSFENGGTAGGVLENRGLLRKSGGGDTILSSSLVFSNAATVEILTNALQVYQGWHVGGNYTGAGQLRLLGDNHLRGELGFSNAILQTGTFDASEARLHGAVTWVTGTLSTSTNAACVVAGDATLTLVPGFHKYLGGTLTNEGLMQLTGNTELYFSPAAICRLVNAPGGILDSAGADFFVGDGLPNRFLENAGLFRKSGGGDTILSSSLIFSNSATVEIVTNALQVNQGWHVGGSYTGAGQLQLVGDNHLRGELSFSKLRFASGNLDASDAQLHGAVTWVTGTLSTSTNATCVVASDATLTLVPGLLKYLGGTLTNEGLMQLTGNTELYFSLAPVCRLVNAAAGVLDSAGNDNFIGDGLPDRVLENHGIIRKSGGQGNTAVGPNLGLINPGILDLQTGVLQVNGSTTGVASEIRVTLNSSTNYGRLSVAGSVALGGSLSVTRGLGFVPAVNDTFHIVTATAHTGSFATMSGVELGNDLVLLVTNLPAGVDLVAAIDLRPTLTPPLLVGGQFSFQFLSTTGALYSVEYNDDLRTTNWLPRLTIPGDGVLHIISEPATNYPARFFRILRH